MTTEDRGAGREGSGVAGKDELQQVVEERTAQAEAAAGSEPVVNRPAKKAAKRAPAKKAPAAGKAPAAKKAPAAGKAPAAKKAPAQRSGAASGPVVAPAPVAEPGDPTGAPLRAPASEGGLAGEAPSSPDRGRPLSGDDLRAVVEGWSHDPHAVLGAHEAAGGWVVRTLRPDAVSVAVLDEDGTRYEARQLHGGGVYEASLPARPGDYRIEVTYGDGQGGTTAYTVDDPYRWLPTLGELDQHLIREGRHERLWDVLGAHVRRYETPGGTVEGVSFAVWAPNARGVKVTSMR